MEIGLADSLFFVFARTVSCLSVNETEESMTGISMSGPTTVDTATIGIEAKAAKAIAMARASIFVMGAR
jgi:hypothetical protein